MLVSKKTLPEIPLTSVYHYFHVKIHTWSSKGISTNPHPISWTISRINVSRHLPTRVHLLSIMESSDFFLSALCREWQHTRSLPQPLPSTVVVAITPHFCFLRHAHADYDVVCYWAAMQQALTDIGKTLHRAQALSVAGGMSAGERLIKHWMSAFNTFL